MRNQQVTGDIRGPLPPNPDDLNVLWVYDRLYDLQIILGEFDGRDNQDTPCIQKDIGHFGQPSDMFFTMVPARFDILIDSIEDVSDADEVDNLPIAEEAVFESLRNGLLAGMLPPGNQNQCRFL